MCSIDPGTRTPWTCFDVHRKMFYDVYPDLVPCLANLHNDISTLQSGAQCRQTWSKKRRSKRKRKRKRKENTTMRNKRARNWRPSRKHLIQDIYDKAKTLVRHAHNAFANHLVSTYDVVILPEFMTSRMVKKRRKQLKLPPTKEEADMEGINRPRWTLHKTTRKAMGWISHYAFRQRLISKALADPHEKKEIVCTTEEYTTKQCPYCDFVHHKIGSNKIFRCGNEACNFVGRRDNVGAFNIALRSIVKGEVKEVL